MRGTRPTETASPPRGMTLIELLVVIVLLTTLVTTAIPIISPGGEERKLREASRSVNAYLQGAQARAIESGRPYGVAFRRLSADTDKPEDNAVCAQLRYVEVPPAYSGIDSSSMVRLLIPPVLRNDVDGVNTNQIALQFLRYGSDTPSETDGLPGGYDFDLVPDAFLRPGDFIQVSDHRFVFSKATFRSTPFQNTNLITAAIYGEGEPGQNHFRINANLSERTVFLIDLDFDEMGVRLSHRQDGSPIDSPESLVSVNDAYLATTPTPYKIYRQPTLAGGEPLELPSGVAIDLQASVFGNGTRVYRPDQDYVGSAFRLHTEEFKVLFSPEGSIHRVHGVPDLDGPQPVSGWLALLLGRRELIPAKPQGVVGTPTRQNYAEPIDLANNYYTGLSETEATELTDQYNWLNLESQWVVIGGQSGSVTSIDNSAVYPADAETNGDPKTINLGEQLSAALQNAPRRTASGGR